jgi:hypothetical protein
MSARRPRRRALAFNIISGLVGLAACLAVAAYAATERSSLSRPSRGPSIARRAPGPSILRHPPTVATSTGALFTFTAATSFQVEFQCRLDQYAWMPCGSPIRFKRLALGRHRFQVRAVGSATGGRPGQSSTASRFSWTVVPVKALTIEPKLSSLGNLYPGAPPSALPLSVANPNAVPIVVTSLHVLVTGDPPGCPSAENLMLIPSNASDARPLRIPAGGTARVPSQGVKAPAIQLRELPVNQDACQHAQFPLGFSGTAHG